MCVCITDRDIKYIYHHGLGLNSMKVATLGVHYSRLKKYPAVEGKTASGCFNQASNHTFQRKEGKEWSFLNLLLKMIYYYLEKIGAKNLGQDLSK